MNEPLKVQGYHGTTTEMAASIQENGFHISDNDWDWLGTGVYFWQDAPLRAWEWADELAGKRGSQPAVIRAEILLEECMDLLDIKWAEALRALYQILEREYQLQGRELPMNKGKAHYLDKVVMDYAVSKAYTGYNIPIRVIRGAFPEGQEIYPGSAIYNRNHVQIAVLDSSLIQNVQQLERG